MKAGVSVVVAAVVMASTVTIGVHAHVTPVVIMRKQSDVIRSTLPAAVSYFVTRATIGRPQLQTISDRAHYTPSSNNATFFSGKDTAGRVVGTVIFPQVDTPHGPIEVGVTIATDGAVSQVSVTRASVEMKPWILQVERSGALGTLRGMRAEDGPKRLSSEAGLGGMPGYMADAIATAALRGLVLYSVLQSPGSPGT